MVVWLSGFRWQFHETTARGLSRLAFVLFGLLPIILCVAWSGVQFLPAYQGLLSARWESWLSSQLGVNVAVAAYERRSPERFALHGIHLTHPETGASIGRVRLVEVQREGSRWAVRLTQPELEGRQLATTWRVVHDWFLCRPQRYAEAARIGMSELTIHGALDGETLTDISIQMSPTTEAVLVNIGFRLAGAPSPSPTPSTLGQSEQIPQLAQLIIKRYHGQDALRTELQLRTSATPLPCSLVAGLFPKVSLLGSGARFAGIVNLDLTHDAWQARITSGSFTGVDLGRLTAGTGAVLSGHGEVLFLEQAMLNSQRLELARGVGQIRSGQIASPFFHALGRYLGFELRATNPVSSYGFDDLRFAFDIRQSGLQLVGVVEDAHGTLAVRDQSKGSEAIPLERMVMALAGCTASGSAQSEVDAVSSSWISRQALAWLPLGQEQLQTAQRNLRLSQTR